MDYTTLQQPWIQQRDTTHRLPVRKNSPYYFGHHPNNWELMLYQKPSKSKKANPPPVIIPMLIPQLHTVKLDAGVNAIRAKGSGLDTSVMRARMEEQGWILLYPEQHDYIRVYPAVGGKYYSSKFVKMENLAGRLIETFDHKAFQDFRRELMLKGSINLPHPAIIKLKLVDLGRSMNRYEQTQHIPEHATRMRSHQQDYTYIEQAMDLIAKKGADAYVTG